MALVVVGGFITGGPGARPACGQDILGIYFDPDGTVTSVTTSSPFETVTGYLLIVEPTEPSGVSGWECAVEIVTATGPLAASWTLNGLALNIDTPPSFQVGLADPLPGSQAVLLATCEVVVPDPGDEVEFYVHCHDPPSIPNPPGGQCVPAYAAGDDPAHLIPLGWPDGCDMLPVAVINDDQIAPLMGPTLDPASLDFGEVNVGDSAVETILVGNDFAHSLRGTARVEGDHYRIRRGIDPFGTEVEYELLPGHSFVMDVRFAPPRGRRLCSRHRFLAVRPGCPHPAGDRGRRRAGVLGQPRHARLRGRAGRPARRRRVHHPECRQRDPRGLPLLVQQRFRGAVHPQRQ